MAIVRFRLDHPDKEKPQKAVSILVQLYVGIKNRPEMSTGEKIIPGKWDKVKERVKSSHTGHHAINQHLDTIKAQLLQLWRDNKEASREELKSGMAKILKGSAVAPEKKTLFEALTRFIDSYSGERATTSVKMYRTLQRRLLEFDAEHPIDIHDLDFNFYDRFKRFLYSLPNYNYNGQSLHLTEHGHYIIKSDDSGLPVGIFDDKVFKYFINLKTFLAWAEKRGYGNINPSYKSWEIIKRKYPPISLTMEELEKLEAVELTGTMAIARDYLVLECRTGQRISDLKRFDRKDLDGFKWVNRPKKGNRISNKVVNVYFEGYTLPAYWILQKYDFKMPALSDQRINDYIKEVCRLAGIDQEIYIERWAGSRKVRIQGPKYEFITTHTGRKTFITIALQYLPPKLVKDMAGIDSYETLKHYEGESEESNVREQLRKIQDVPVLRKAN